MNTNDPKFIVRARLADGRADAHEPFAEALAQAGRDPALAGWLAREQAFDATVTARLREFAPPAGLRDAILAGVRMQPATPWWREARTLAWAAGLALVLGLAGTWGLRGATPGEERLALGAMADWEEPSHHPTVMGGTGALRELLADKAGRLATGLPIAFSELRSNGCRVIKVAGREVLEVCFVREGAGELHLYIARREDFGGEALDGRPLFRERGALASVTWADEHHAYVLVSDLGTDALRAVL
jgi:anti-sigma factor RsiW